VHRIAELDGLRGIAVLLVIGFHAWPDVFVGGSYGVIVFFTISGFLITRSLAKELDGSGRVDVRRFFFRRAVRLVPALAIVTAVYLVAGGSTQRAFAALTYTANYARIGEFRLGAIHHTWSLAVEEHFYLLWPFVIAILPPRHRVKALAFMVVVFAGWRGFVITLGASDWVYYGTTTNAVAILAGCLAAIVSLDCWRTRWWMLAVVLLPMLAVHKSEFFYWAGFLVIAATVGVIAAPPKWLAWKPLAYVGLISYSLYLWHYMLLRSELPVLLALVVTFLVAALSWKVLEEPLLRRSRQPASVQ
jgi:peptidoglycan/LPS O-acetylase OafA/YrhL